MNEIEEQNDSLTLIATVEDAQQAERIAALESQLASLAARVDALEQAAAKSVEASAAQPSGARKTLPAGMATMLAKNGCAGDGIEAGASLDKLDSALATLSIEQRIAVKSEMLRAGLL